jgi:hypothetical protein
VRTLDVTFEAIKVTRLTHSSIKGTSQGPIAKKNIEGMFSTQAGRRADDVLEHRQLSAKDAKWADSVDPKITLKPIPDQQQNSPTAPQWDDSFRGANHR